jgi:hypothetical protein
VCHDNTMYDVIDVATSCDSSEIRKPSFILFSHMQATVQEDSLWTKGHRNTATSHFLTGAYDDMKRGDAEFQGR